ncbi:TonB-dependent receptor [Gemmatimonas phototrophica]|uniref:TonB-dependent receptor n=1 Tax=Gemmatimonas phototrophica TaxID=1379270 RepID=UPI0013147CFC|nr:TonB-dependent receptor [Gemmatimonas phototrophica]
MTVRMPGRCARQWVQRTVVALVTMVTLVAAGVSSVQAQVRPDTLRKSDSVRVSVPVPSPDSGAARRSPEADSSLRARARQVADSLAKVKAGDTIRSPLARFETPRNMETVDRLRWRGDSIMGSGAINLADLLDRVPGITTYRSGWFAGLHGASLNGDASRIRIFLDGVELDAVEPRNGGMLDLTDVPIWNLDEVVLERSPGEVRVWLRSKTVTSITPATRVDIFTGDLNTNAFRGFLARRWRNGAVLQLGGQQIATQSGRVSAFGGTEGSTRLRSDGESQSFYARVGWSRGKLSVDGFANSIGRERDAHTPRTDYLALPSFKGQRREGYLRVGYGDTTRGFWSQAIMNALRTKQQGRDTTIITDGDTVVVEGDTIRGQTQHVVAVGYRGSWWTASLTNRLRPRAGTLEQAPVARAQAQWWKLDAGAWVERNGRDSTDRTELFARVRPVPWLAVVVGRSSRSPDDTTGRPAASTLRAEAAVKVKRLWFGGGVIRDDATVYGTLPLLGPTPSVIAANPATGVTVSANGRLYKDVYVDVQAVSWDAAQYNRPKTQIRTEIALISEWRSKFPKGQFGFNARLIFDSRSGVPFFYGPDEDPLKWTTEPAQVATGLLEIRLQRGTLFYQYRNLTGGQYEQIRGITMPPAVQMYGVRWEFSN